MHKPLTRKDFVKKLDTVLNDYKLKYCPGSLTTTSYLHIKDFGFPIRIYWYAYNQTEEDLNHFISLMAPVKGANKIFLNRYSYFLEYLSRSGFCPDRWRRLKRHRTRDYLLFDEHVMFIKNCSPNRIFESLKEIPKPGDILFNIKTQAHNNEQADKSYVVYEVTPFAPYSEFCHNNTDGSYCLHHYHLYSITFFVDGHEKETGNFFCKEPLVVRI